MIMVTCPKSRTRNGFTTSFCTPSAYPLQLHPLPPLVVLVFPINVAFFLTDSCPTNASCSSPLPTMLHAALHQACLTSTPVYSSRCACTHSRLHTSFSFTTAACSYCVAATLIGQMMMRLLPGGMLPSCTLHRLSLFPFPATFFIGVPTDQT